MLPSITILFIHWFGDYLLQTNEIAAKKSQSISWLTIHVVLYSISLLVGVLLLMTLTDIMPRNHIPLFIGINGALHWITDLVTSRVAQRVSHNPRLYYPLIGFDQFLHSATLLYTLQWLA
jgi:hypothetical protein